MDTNLSYYLQKFCKLRVDRSRGIAPHKPILLLSVIELVEQGLLRKNMIFLSVELVATFLKYWDNLGSESHRSDIALPFFHMSSEGFWHLKPKPGFESVISSKVKLRTISALRDAVQYAYLDEQLFDLLQAPIARSNLVNIITNAWFHDKKQQIEKLFQINAFQDFQNYLMEKGGVVYKVEEIADESRAVVRDAAFRKIIVSIYDYRCALCGLQVINSLNQSIVDGAHIKPFSKFYDDRIDNGISLCKNHHWAFDRGWFTIDDDYTLIVSNDLREESPNAKPLRDSQGEHIILPVKKQYHPRIEAITWHRENVFNRSEQLNLY